MFPGETGEVWEVWTRKGEVFYISKEDVKLVRQYTWSVLRYTGRVFAQTERIDLARSILLGKRRSKKWVGFRSGDKLDLRRGNLRLETISQKMMQRVKPRTLGVEFGYGGVVKRGKKWRGVCRVMGKEYHSCMVETEEEAAREYDRLARKHHGEFAVLNFPEEMNPGDPKNRGPEKRNETSID